MTTYTLLIVTGYDDTPARTPGRGISSEKSSAAEAPAPSSSSHLEWTFGRIQELIRRAEAGDRKAYKALYFAVHYGRPGRPLSR
jgi:hypothetical protein